MGSGVGVCLGHSWHLECICLCSGRVMEYTVCFLQIDICSVVSWSVVLKVQTARARFVGAEMVPHPQLRREGPGCTLSVWSFGDDSQSRKAGGEQGEDLDFSFRSAVQHEHTQG